MTTSVWEHSVKEPQMCFVLTPELFLVILVRHLPWKMTVIFSFVFVWEDSTELLLKADSEYRKGVGEGLGLVVSFRD